MINNVYYAAPLFTQAEWQWNERLATELRRIGYTVTLPQDKAKPMLMQPENFDPTILFQENISAISNSDCVLAILDQADPDSGTCWECGYAYKSGKPIVGLRTDLRPAGDDGNRPVNLMLARSCQEFVTLPFDKRDDLMWIASQTDAAIRRINSTTLITEQS